MTMLRLLEYMVRIWRRYVRKHKHAPKLPIIVPVVLHHSKTGWTRPRRLRDVLDVDPALWDAAMPFIPDFTAIFDDISHLAPGQLKRRRMTPQGKLVLYCLRYGQSPDELFQGLTGWTDVLLAVVNSLDGDAAIAAMLEYLQSVTRLDEEAVVMAMNGVLGDSVAERIIHAGDRLIAKGERKGERKGKCSTLLRQLRARFGELPQEALDQVQSAGSNQLDEMAIRVLTAATLQEVLQQP